MPSYTFQESKIWEARNPVDPNRKPAQVKGKNEISARKRLPKAELGRVWVLIKN